MKYTKYCSEKPRFGKLNHTWCFCKSFVQKQMTLNTLVLLYIQPKITKSTSKIKPFIKQVAVHVVGWLCQQHKKWWQKSICMEYQKKLIHIQAIFLGWRYWWLTTKNSKTETEHKSVAKVETGLEEASHLCLHEIVVDWVEQHITSCWCCRNEWCPLPVVVLSIQQKVGPHNSHTHCYNCKYQEHKEHEPIHIIHLQQKSSWIKCYPAGLK